MPASAAREIVAWTRERGLDPHLNHLERLIVRRDDPRAEEYGAFIGGDPELSGDLVDSIRHPITKILAAGEPPLPSELAPVARQRFDGMAAVTISHPRFLEFTAPGVSKGRAIRWLARRLKIPLGGVLAIGDQWNDIEMLAEVGHGAAMPTAPVEVLAAARYVAPPLAEEGVARMIESLVLADPALARAAVDRLTIEAIATRRERSDGAVAGQVEVAVEA
jgi:hydroxymethylpyrimidine pyrophosphatase-like HAD family hydrolase